MVPSLRLLCIVSVLANFPLIAAPLEQAKVTRIINDVKVVDPSGSDRAAHLDDTIRGEIGLRTGIKSRSELLFQDDTLTRIGPESYFSFRPGTREMDLKSGSLLLQVPKNLGGAKIHAAAVTASITGTTIMMEYEPNRSLKVLVLEGSLRLSTGGLMGDSLMLLPGKMVIMSPDAKHIPDPVTVDLKKLTQTSKLVNLAGGKALKASKTVLPSNDLIEKEVALQDNGKAGHHLTETNLVILGKGTNVLLGSDDLMETLSQHNDAVLANATPIATPIPAPPPPVAPPASTPAPTPNQNPTPNPNPPPVNPPPPPPAGTYLTDATSVIATSNQGPTITTQGASQAGAIYKDVMTNGSPSAFLFGATSVFDNEFGFDSMFTHNFGQTAVYVFSSLQLGGGFTFSTANGVNSVALVGNNGITDVGGSTITLAGVNDVLFGTTAGNITLSSGTSFGTNNPGQLGFLEFYARGGDLTVGSTFAFPNASLNFAAEDNVLFDSSSSITAKRIAITGLISAAFDGTAVTNGGDGLFQMNGGALELGGNVTAQTGYLYGSSMVLNGSFTGQTLTVNVTGNFLMSGTATLSLSNGLQITAGGLVTINAPYNGNFTITAHDMAFGADISLTNPTSKGELTATNGNIDATGHSLTGFDQISLNTGNLTAGNLVAKTLAVGGTLSGGSIVANNITANALHVDSLTANQSLTVAGSDFAPYSSSTISINTPLLTLTTGATLNGTNGSALLAPGNGFNLAITTSNFTLATPLNLNGGDGDVSANDAGGNGGQLDLTSNNNLTINAPITATTGQNSTNAVTGGQGGTVNLNAQNIAVNNTIAVSSSDGNRRRSARGGNINLTSTANGGPAISISSSAQLLALLDAAAPGPGGTIKLTSPGGDININGKIQADQGTILVTNTNSSGGNITLTNATLAADVVKIGILGQGGNLNIGGGTISANTAIKLYAGSSNGQVNFLDNVTLNGNSVKTIAGNTVTISNGKIVTVNGPTPADVFTNHPNYTGYGGNAMTTGTFAGQGAVTHPLSAAPGF